jgi:hypothetical protein
MRYHSNSIFFIPKNKKLGNEKIKLIFENLKPNDPKIKNINKKKLKINY